MRTFKVTKPAGTLQYIECDRIDFRDGVVLFLNGADPREIPFVAKAFPRGAWSAVEEEDQSPSEDGESPGLTDEFIQSIDDRLAQSTWLVDGIRSHGAGIEPMTIIPGDRLKLIRAILAEASEE